MKRLFALIIGFVTLAGVSLFSQGEFDPNTPIVPTYDRDPIYLGFTFGYNRVNHSVTKPTNDLQKNLCPQFENGSDNGFWAGITFEHFFGAFESSKSSLIIRALYSTYPSYLEVVGQEYPKNIRYDGNGDGIIDTSQIVKTSVTNKDVVEYNVASVELAFKIKPITGINFGITIGPTIDYAITATNKQSFELTKPTNAQFIRLPDQVIKDNNYKYENNDRSLVFYDGDIEEAQQLRFGLKIGLQYEINLPGKWYIAPAVYYNLGLTNLQKDLDWRVHALQIGIDIRRPIRWDKLFN